jgi:microcystin-dependent protein
MDISSKKSRADLTAYFKKNSIPTAANFADFIGSVIVQKDDGITKPPGDPLCLEAATQIYKPALNLYEEFTDANPSWTLALASTSGNRGFAVGNVPPNQVGIETRFFIELTTGNIGIGTVGPSQKLDVVGGIRAHDVFISGGAAIGTTLEVTGAVSAKSTVDIDGALKVNAGATIVGNIAAQNAAFVDNVTANAMNVTATLSAGSVQITNGLSGAQATFSGATSAASATISGAISAASATITNNLNAGSATIQGAVTAQNATVKTTLQVASIVAQSDNPTADLLLSGKGPSGAVKASTPVIADASVTIAGKLTANAAVDVVGKLSAKAAAEVLGKLDAGALNVSGAVNMSSTTTITGKLTANGGADFSNAARTNPNDHPNGRPFYVSGTITNAQGIEFRTSDATQGLGFGPNTIYAAGTSATQDLVFAPKGTAEAPGIVRVKSAAVIQSGLSVDSITPQNADANANLTLSAKGASGQVRVTSALVGTSTLDITGKTTVGGAFDVTGAVTARSTLEVTGKVTARAALDVTGALIARSTMEVTGKVTASDALDVTGAVYAKATLDVTGKISATGGLDLRYGQRTNAEFHPSGRPLYVTGAITNQAGIEFRTSDANQGIGFGPTTIYAAGTAPTQDLVLTPKGTADAPGKVTISSAMVVSGSVRATSAHLQGAVEATSASISGALNAATLQIGSQGAVATTIADSITTTTPAMALPTTSAMRAYVSSVLPGFATNLSTAGNTELATVSAVKDYVNRAIPIGSILMWKGATIPEGWALCNGENNTPNLADKFILGKGSRTIGTTGGATTVTLTVDQLPAHNHSSHMSGAGTHNHEVYGYRADLKHAGGATESGLHNDGDGFMNPLPRTSNAGDHTHGLAINNTGGGQAHENMPPYYVLAYIIRVS